MNEKSHNAPLLHSLPEAARLVGVKRTTFYELIRRGEIRQVHIGRRALIADAEIRRFVGELVAKAAER